MQTISRNKIRNIVVNLVEGCHVEIQAQKTSKSRHYQVKKYFITFGSRHTDAVGRYFSVYHCITDKGRTLEIYTLEDKSGSVFTHTPYFFKIIIPEGCILKFKYSPQPLGWGPR